MANYLLSNVIKEYLIEIGDFSYNRASRFYQFGTACFRELSHSVSSTPKTIKLPIDNNGECNLPTDFLNYISISVVGQDGLLWGLGLNVNINLASYYNSCGQPIRESLPNGVNTVGSVTQWQIGNPNYLANHYRNGENFGAYFNVGGRNVTGEYVIDYNRNKIVLGAFRLDNNAIQGVNDEFVVQVPNCIILEYIADINAKDSDYQIHPFLIEPIKAWIYWKNIQRDRNFSLGEKQTAEQSYRRARKEAIHSYTNGTFQEWLDSMRKANHAIPAF